MQTTKEDVVPNFSNAKNIDVSKSEDGKIVINLKNKKEEAPTKVEDKPQIKEPIKVVKKLDKPQAKKKVTPTKKEQKKRNPIENNEPKRAPIEVRKIDKASERNKNSNLPSKGLWGLIKSFFS